MKIRRWHVVEHIVVVCLYDMIFVISISLSCVVHHVALNSEMRHLLTHMFNVCARLLRVWVRLITTWARVFPVCTFVRTLLSKHTQRVDNSKPLRSGLASQ